MPFSEPVLRMDSRAYACTHRQEFPGLGVELAVGCQIQSAIFAGQIEEALEYIRKDVREKESPTRLTALDLAAWFEYPQLVRPLLQAGSDIDVQCRLGQRFVSTTEKPRPIDFAVAVRHDDMLRLLVILGSPLRDPARGECALPARLIILAWRRLS